MRSPRFLRNLRARDLRGIDWGGNVRSFFSDNLSLKIFSLILAITMWGFVASQRRGESTEIKFTTPLVLKNIPSDLEVTSEITESVSVLVRVRRDLAKSVNPNQFQVAVDLRNQLPGNFEMSLNERNLTYNNQVDPPGVSVLQISPASIPLVLEPTFEKLVQVKPRFAGDLAKGYTIESISITPPQAPLRGPRTLLSNLNSVLTRPLDVQDLNTDVEMLVALELPNQVRLKSDKQNFFRAMIKVSNNPTRVLFRGIPVAFENAEFSYKSSIATLNVHLEGPKEIMDRLTREQVFAIVDLKNYPPGDYRGLSPGVVVPETVRVLEQWPILDLFVLKRKLEKNEEDGPRPGASKVSARAASG